MRPARMNDIRFVHGSGKRVQEVDDMAVKSSAPVIRAGHNSPSRPFDESSHLVESNQV